MAFPLLPVSWGKPKGGAAYLPWAVLLTASVIRARRPILANRSGQFSTRPDMGEDYVDYHNLHEALG